MNIKKFFFKYEFVKKRLFIRLYMMLSVSAPVLDFFFLSRKKQVTHITRITYNTKETTRNWIRKNAVLAVNSIIPSKNKNHVFHP